MKIEWVSVCRYAETGQDGTSALGLHSYVSQPVDLPRQFTLSTVISFTDLLDLPAIDALSCRVVHPDESVIYEDTWTMMLEVADPAALPAGAEPKHALSVPITFDVQDSGPYRIEFGTGDGNVVGVTYVVRSVQE
jgi:hypothetical protein